MSSVNLDNKTASIVNQILKGLIEGSGEDLIIALAIGEQPWLGLPFIKQIFTYIVGIVGKYIYIQAAHVATAIVIDIQTAGEASATNDAYQNLQVAILSGDETAINKASGDLDEAYANLVNFDGSSPA